MNAQETRRRQIVAHVVEGTVPKSDVDKYLAGEPAPVNMQHIDKFVAKRGSDNPPKNSESLTRKRVSDRHARMPSTNKKEKDMSKQDPVVSEETIDEAKPVKKTQEEFEAEKVSALQTQYPVGTLIEFVGKGNEFIKNQGEIVGVEARRGVPYLAIKVTRYSDGRVRPDDKQKVVLTRDTSVEVIEAYREKVVPAKEEKAVEEA